MTKKQIRIKDAITIISSFNASQLLLVSEVLKLLKLILTVPATNGVTASATNGVTVPATNGVSEKSRRFKTAIIYDSRASKFLLILLLIKKK